MWKAVCAACCAVAFSPMPAAAQPLTMSGVIALARERAPRVIAARLAIEEARARIPGAKARQSNPEIEGDLGRRWASDGGVLDLDIGISQQFEPAGRRSARLAIAEALVAQASADADTVTRTVIVDAVRAYLRAAQGVERDRLLGTAEILANGLLQAADRRFRAGDVAVLDVNVARAALARVRADRETARASASSARSELAIVLGIRGDVVIDATIPVPATTDIADLERSARERPELRALEAAVQAADGDVRLGRTFSKPEFGTGARFAIDDRDKVVTGLFRITLPVFQKGQDIVGAGSARALRLRAELENWRARVQIELHQAAEGVARRREALRILEQDAIPAIDENETLATRSYDAGQIGLAELLLIRRDILETRFQRLDAQLELAMAKVELEASAGVLK